MNNLSALTDGERMGSSFQIIMQSLPTGFAFLKAVISHPGQAMQIFRMAEAAKKKEKHVWQRDLNNLPYEIPAYSEDMKRCASSEKYLRPSYLIESDAPEIVAFAHKLGAFEKPDKEYAEACFNFIRRSIRFSFAAPIKGALKTLKIGEAVCFDKAHLFVALCRAGNIPARLKSVNAAFTQQIYEGFTKELPIIKDLYDSVGYFTMHTMAEAFIDGKWLVGDVSIDDCYQAALGLPLSKLGDDSSGQWNWEAPGATLRYESIPFLFVLTANIGLRLNRGLVLMIQDSWGEGLLKEGRRVIDEAGGEEEYDRKARLTYRAKLPEVSKKLFMLLNGEENTAGGRQKELIFERN